MKYIVYGFAYLQDMIEHGLIRAQSGSDDVGIVLQQFPYPCYVKDRWEFILCFQAVLSMVLCGSWNMPDAVAGHMADGTKVT